MRWLVVAESSGPGDHCTIALFVHGPPAIIRLFKRCDGLESTKGSPSGLVSPDVPCETVAPHLHAADARIVSLVLLVSPHLHNFNIHVSPWDTLLFGGIEDLGESGWTIHFLYWTLLWIKVVWISYFTSHNSQYFYLIKIVYYSWLIMCTLMCKSHSKVVVIAER